MNRNLTFVINIHDVSTHWVNVILYPTRALIRRELTKRGHNSTQTNAACWQANKPGKDHLIAEIHLARTHLSYETIAHESCHAAYHRAVLIGVPLTAARFQEYVAEDTGRITDAILAMLAAKKIPVEYRSNVKTPTVLIKRTNT